MSSREKLFGAFGVIGVIVGIVALVIAIGAKNDANSNQEAQDQAAQELEARLSDKADQLRQGLVGDIKQTAAVHSEAKKAGKKGARAEKAGKKAQRTGNAAAKQAAENKTTIDKLERENEQLSHDVKQLQQQQQATNQQIENLKLKVRLKKNKR
jgi:hypothetical protein